MALAGIDCNSKNYLFCSYSNRRKLQPLTYRAVQYIIEKYVRLARIEKKISAHSLRHSCATIALENGARIDKVKLHLRHADISTTMRYVHDLDFVKENAADFLEL